SCRRVMTGDNRSPVHITVNDISGRGQAAAYECFVGLVKPGWCLDGGGIDTGATGALDRRIRTLKRDTLAGSQRVTGDDTPIREALGDVRRSVNPRKLKIKLAAC